MRARGILYHPAVPAGGHFSFVTLCNGKTRGNNTKQEMLARENIAETRDLIAAERPDYLLISGESLFSLHPDILMPVLTEITGTPVPVHIVAFLRHPVDFYLSSVQQALKASHDFVAPKTFRRDFSSTFDRWSAYPGCESITVRLFDRQHLTNGSAVAEFSAILQTIAGPDTPKLPEANVNSSLSAEQMIVMQKFRRTFLAERNGQFAPPSNWVVRFFEELNDSVGLVGTRPALRPDVQACIGEQNAPFVDAIERRFPELGMSAARILPVLDWRASADQWTADIASILASHDPELVQRLIALLPDFDPALEDPTQLPRLRQAITALGKGRPALAPYIRYLDRSGRKSVAASLRQKPLWKE